MTEQEIRDAVREMEHSELVELVVHLAISEQEKREQLDKLQGIIR